MTDLKAVSTPLPQYTNEALGEGLFDQLMEAVGVRLKEEYKRGRISGTEYSKVYLGAMESVLQNSTQFLLGTMLINEQRDKAAVEVELVQKQVDKLDIEIALGKLELQKMKYELENILPQQLLLIQAQISKINAEIAFLDAQEAHMIKQGQKIDQEILFLIQKVQTEKANTVAGVAAPGSLIGKQISLLTAQKLGFAGDLQAKIAKMYADYDAVFQSVQEVPEASDLGSAAILALGEAVSTAAAISVA